jgi:hypothetical protein
MSHCRGRLALAVLSACCVNVVTAQEAAAQAVRKARYLVMDEATPFVLYGAGGLPVFPDSNATSGVLEVRLWEPDLLFFELEDPNRTFAFLHRDAGDTLRFDYAAPALSLNGRVVAVDLRNRAARSWLASPAAASLEGTAGVQLRGDPAVDLPFLERLPEGAGIFVDVVAYEDSVPAAVAAAIRAARPEGLRLAAGPGTTQLLTASAHVRYLVLDGAPGELPAAMPNLEVLILEEGFTEPVDLETLRRFPALRRLHVAGAVTGVGALEHMPALRSLGLLWADRRDVAELARLSRLEELSLTDADQLRDVSALASLTALASLALLGLPDDDQPLVGIDRLATLEGLELILVSEHSLAHDSVQWNGLRAARPSLRIIGFCVGSWLLLLVLGAGTTAGLLLRHVHRAATRA